MGCSSGSGPTPCGAPCCACITASILRKVATGGGDLTGFMGDLDGSVPTLGTVYLVASRDVGGVEQVRTYPYPGAPNFVKSGATDAAIAAALEPSYDPATQTRFNLGSTTTASATSVTTVTNFNVGVAGRSDTSSVTDSITDTVTLSSPYTVDALAGAADAAVYPATFSTPGGGVVSQFGVEKFAIGAPGIALTTDLAMGNTRAAGSVTANKSMIQMTWTIPAYCEGTGSYKLNIILQFSDGVHDPTYTDLSATVTPAPGDVTIVKVVEADTIGTAGTLTLMGGAVLGQTGVYGETQGASAFKNGFLEYVNQSTPPKVYMTETATGAGFPGCSDDGRTAKTYTGMQNTGPLVVVPAFTDPSGDLSEVVYQYDSFENYLAGPGTFSPDVVAGSRYSGLYPANGIGSPNFNFGLSPVNFDGPGWPGAGGIPFASPDGATMRTQTVRTWNLVTPCGGSSVTDNQVMTLSGEITTAALQLAVDNFVANDWDTVELLSTVAFLGPKGELAAGKFLSPGQIFYARQKMRFKIEGTIPYVFATDQTFDFAYKIYTKDLLTGEVTSEDATASLLFPTGATDVMEDDFTEIDPDDNTLVWIVPGPGPSNGNFYDATPTACSTNVPALLSS